jgi:hypothetical protein
VSSPGLLSDRHELEALFDELAMELERLGVTAEVVMVGGSWMLWHSQRAATRDVDSAQRLATGLGEAIRRVASRHDLSDGWLNDNAAPYWPADASFDDCMIVFERASLVVKTPPAEVIFVMKLYRSEPQDREDMIILWPLCNFGSAEVAAQAFEAAYPHAPEDKRLVNYIRGIARDAR